MNSKSSFDRLLTHSRCNKIEIPFRDSEIDYSNSF